MVKEVGRTMRRGREIGNIHDHVLNQLSVLLQTEVQNIQVQKASQSNASNVGIQ